MKYINWVDNFIKDVKLVKPLNQLMTPSTLEFEVVNGHDQYQCNDWVMIYRHSGLSGDELNVGQTFRDKSECIIIVKWWHIKNSMHYKVHHSTKTYMQL